MNNIALRQKILNSNRIPILPNQTRNLLQALGHDDLSYRELTVILEVHPSISARLIALANSAWAAPSQPVKSLEKACLNLGFAIVRSVSIGLALISPFNIASCPGFDIRRFWSSGKLVADTASQLASSMPSEPEPEFLQTVHTDGLLHNLGLLCLADMLPKETHQALSRVNSTPELTVNTVLHATLMTDYCEIGSLFAEIWGLPENLITVMQRHCDLAYQGKYWEESRLIGCAAAMVGAVFRDRQTIPEFASLEKLAISPSDQQSVFQQLQSQFLATNELARNLFSPQ